MRILMLSQFYSPVVGGQERAVEDLSRALARRGHHVAVVTLGTDGATGSTQENGVTIHRVLGSFQRLNRLFSDPGRPHLPPAPDPGAMRALRRIVDLESPDVVHAHDWFAWSAARVIRRRRLPFLMSLHDYSLVCANKRLMQGERVCSGPGLLKCARCAPATYGRAKGIPVTLALRSLTPGVTSAVDRFLPVSQAVATAARLAALGLPFEVMPNFVPDSLLDRTERAGHHNGTASREGTASGYGIFVGDITRDKGAAVLLEAHARLGGDPPLEMIGRMLLDDPGPHSHSVVFRGPRPHDVVIDAIGRSLFAVVPSICPETFGLVALEAMALGRPVVAARSGGLGDLVVDGRTGISVPPGDSGALAAAMARLHHDDSLRAWMGEQARSRARTFSESAVVPRVERVYYEVMAAHSVPPRRGSRAAAAGPDGDPPSSPGHGGMTPAGRRKRLILLCALGIVTVTATVALLHYGVPAGVRIAVGIPFLFAAPGYALERALFPARSGGWPQLAALMLGLSLIATILVTLVLNLLPWGLSSATWAIGIGSLTVAAAVFGAHRPAARTGPRPRDVGLLALAGVVAAAAVVLAFRPLGPPPSARGYTELWLVHHRQTVEVGVACYEHQSTRYLVEVLNGRKLEYRDFIVLDPAQRWVTSLPQSRRTLEAKLWLRPGTAKPKLYREVRLAPGSRK